MSIIDFSYQKERCNFLFSPFFDLPKNNGGRSHGASTMMFMFSLPVFRLAQIAGNILVQANVVDDYAYTGEAHELALQ